MEQPPQGFGALLVEGVRSALRTRGFGRQSGKATLVEVVDGIARLLTGAAPQRERAICGARSPLSLARMTWARRMTKASLERNAVCNCSFCVSESERTKIAGLMVSTIASHTKPILDMH